MNPVAVASIENRRPALTKAARPLRQPPPCALRVIALALGIGGMHAVAAAQAPRDASADPQAALACESAVSDTLREMRGNVHDLRFAAAARAFAPGAGNETAVAGQGRYRRPGGGSVMPFTYRCAYDTQTGKTSGVMFRETDATKTAAVAQQPWEPDLTHINPDACQAAAAAALKEKYPPAGHIVFKSGSLKLAPAGVKSRTSVEGQGRLERAVGMNPADFSYRCVVETASGKVVSVRTQD